MEKNNIILKVKWRFNNLPNIVRTEEGELWQLPFTSGRNSYRYRLIPKKWHQNQYKYRIYKDWYSERKLDELAYLHSETIDTGLLKEHLRPFNENLTFFEE